MTIRIIISLILLSTISFNSTAASVLPLDINQVNNQASRIFHGICISNETGFDEESGQTVTWSTFDIIENIKGPANEKNYVLKQIGGLDSENGIVFEVHGIPKFTVGNEYVLFLYGKSKIGLSSPVGLQQGHFPVNHANGSVSNGRDPQEFFSNIPQSVALPPAISDAANPKPTSTKQKGKPGFDNKAKSDVPLGEFLDLVRQLNQ
ncbi:MAG: hypothetical protein OEZ58_21310 [Gammaproteobacteria bacterium]|nr:hypothetical protein [Gammaproteobacteria bacterium]MDH5731532.1 hypothetical protein [Gammaproteobacteria bacterium]